MAGTPVAGDLYMRVDGQLFELKRQLRQGSGYPFDVERLMARLQDLIEGRFARPNCLSFVMRKRLPAVAGKKTKDCFTRPMFRSYIKEEDLLRFPTMQSSSEGRPVLVQETISRMSVTYVDIAECLLRLEVPAPLESQLISQRSILSLPQIETMVVLQEGGEDMGLSCIEHSSNLFLTLGNEGTIVPLILQRTGVGWHVYPQNIRDGRKWPPRMRVISAGEW